MTAKQKESKKKKKKYNVPFLGISHHGFCWETDLARDGS